MNRRNWFATMLGALASRVLPGHTILEPKPVETYPAKNLVDALIQQGWVIRYKTPDAITLSTRKSPIGVSARVVIPRKYCPDRFIVGPYQCFSFHRSGYVNGAGVIHDKRFDRDITYRF